MSNKKNFKFPFSEPFRGNQKKNVERKISAFLWHFRILRHQFLFSFFLIHLLLFLRTLVVIFPTRKFLFHRREIFYLLISELASRKAITSSFLLQLPHKIFTVIIKKFLPFIHCVLRFGYSAIPTSPSII